MILSGEIRADAQFISMLSSRAFNRFIKGAQQEQIGFWHKSYAPSHFKEIAYSKYPVYRLHFKPKLGDPLVDTGNLRDSVLKRIDISGTSNGARGKMFYGSPKRLTAKKIHIYTLARIKLYKEDYKNAKRMVYKKMQGGYSTRNKEIFGIRINAISQDEIERIEQNILDSAKKAYKPTGRKVKVSK